MAGAGLFALASSGVYILNDVADREADRLHPDKRYRPVASGRLAVAAAVRLAALTLATALAAGFALDRRFGLALAAYLLLNGLYSRWLKHIVIIDVMAIAAGFVIRAAAGGFATGVPLTPWFLVCAMMLSLFMAAGKPRAEHELWRLGGCAPRAVLPQYTPELLDQISHVSAAATIMMYAMFTFASGHSRHLMATIPFVVYGVFRYEHRLLKAGEGGQPERLLVQDRWMLANLAAYVAAVAVVLSVFG